MPTVVTNDVLFHEPGRRILQDVVTAIRHNMTIDELGFRRERPTAISRRPKEWGGCLRVIRKRWPTLSR